MNPAADHANLAHQGLPLRDARIDWARGRIIGFSVPAGRDDAFDVVQLRLDGHSVLSTIANRSVFDLSKDLAGLELPAREHSAFEIQIPSRSLHPGLARGSVVHLEIKTSRGEPIFDHFLSGLHELLRLTDEPPSDMLFDVRFRGLSGGALYGSVVDKHRCGIRPSLKVQINEHPAEPLAIYESSGDGTVHHFSVPMSAVRLVDGTNSVAIVGTDNAKLAIYPMILGAAEAGDTERRVIALEAELAFLKRLVLGQNLEEALGSRLALLKGEVIGICSEMLTLQRTNFERELAAHAQDTAASEHGSDAPKPRGGNKRAREGATDKAD
jgi:hypothetical protein